MAVLLRMLYTVLPCCQFKLVLHEPCLFLFLWRSLVAQLG